MPIDYPVQDWLNDAERLAYADYWNDEAAEREKPFWILDGNFEKMERYLAEIGLMQQLERCVFVARQHFERDLHGSGCDLAAGTLWAEPQLLRLAAIDKIYCVEYSRHRLLKIGPALLEHYGVPAEKIELILGDFHHLRWPDSSLDFVFMSAAFHHSDQPELLLQEIGRVLKPDGLIILIGEHVADIHWTHYVKQPVKFLIANLVPPRVQQRLLGRVLTTRGPLPGAQAADDGLGDHEYTSARYRTLFAAAGFRQHCLRDQTLQAFVLTR